jgi:hypothetical protein
VFIQERGGQPVRTPVSVYVGRLSAVIKDFSEK